MWKSILGVTALAGWVGAACADPVAPGAELEPLGVAVSGDRLVGDYPETAVFSVLVSAERIPDMNFDISPLAVAAGVDDEVEMASSVNEAALGGIAGGDAVDDLQLSNATTSGLVTGSTVGANVQTGQIGVTNINDVSGFSTIMLNTGNNVVMQSTTQVNIILK